MLQQDVGFQKVIRTRTYRGLLEILDLDLDIEFLALDFDLPGAGGLGTIRELHERRPSMRMAVFSQRTDLREILAVLAAGAHGFIPKTIGNCAELLRALRTVEEAGIFVPSNLVEPEEKLNGDHNNHALAGLTGRQQQVIQLLSEGHPNKVIARELGISPSTVKVHVHAAFRALGVHSRLAAMAALRPAHRIPAEA